VIQPESLHPQTATELLEPILARDATPQSATTLKREQQDPVGLLGAAAARYVDALRLAAELSSCLAASVDCHPSRDRATLRRQA
jgi:hypothetical protein